MAGRGIHKLSDPAVRAAKPAGRYSDGGGLYLNIASGGTKSWVFIWTPRGAAKRKEMGLGSYPAVTLAKAREKAAECRSTVADGLDPISKRDRSQFKTFGDCVTLFIASVESEWRNAKHRWQWEQTLTARCTAIADKPVSQITTEDVLTVLKPVWTELPETASRLRGRIERVLNFAKVKGWRTGENPAAWRDNLRNLLPKRQRLARGHHPAMAYQDVPKFMAELRQIEGISARALEFTILTVARTGESIGARWSEVAFDKKLWTIPGPRMKAGEEHTVPLSAPAMAILETLKTSSPGEFIFPGNDPKRSLSNMAMLMLLRRSGHPELTVHGFRSAFRDWCGDQTTFAREVAEAALAHKVGNAVEQAYRRSSALEKRAKLMDAWARYCATASAKPKNNVVPIGEAKRTA